MHSICIYVTHAHFDDLERDARSQWLGIGKTKIFKLWHSNCHMTVDFICSDSIIYAHARFDDLDLGHFFNKVSSFVCLYYSETPTSVPVNLADGFWPAVHLWQQASRMVRSRAACRSDLCFCGSFPLATGSTERGEGKTHFKATVSDFWNDR